MTKERKKQHFWTTTEQKIIRDFYPMEGISVSERLPGRSEASIRSIASLMKIKYIGPRISPRRRYKPTPEIDAMIMAAWSKGYQRGTSSRTVSDQCGYPTWWIKRRAITLGLSSRRKRESAWSEAEEQLLRENAHLDLDVIRRKLAKAGYKRTRTAIQIRRKRLNLSCRAADIYCGNQLSKLLGLDSKCVARWIRMDLVHAVLAETERTEKQGGDILWITHQDLRRMIIDNPHLIDLRKVTDQQWFIGLIGGKDADGRQHKRKTPAAVHEETHDG